MHSLPHVESQSIPMSRLEALREKHAMYKHKIKEARQHPSTTDFYLAQLKKQKLAVKEEIENIREIRKAS